MNVRSASTTAADLPGPSRASFLLACRPFLAVVGLCALLAAGCGSAGTAPPLGVLNGPTRGVPVLPDGPAYVYSTYIASNSTFAQGSAIDAAGNAYVTGFTTGGLPTTGPQAQSGFGGGASDAFVNAYDPQGRLLYSTYLGGSGQDMGVGVAVLPGGALAVAGWTNSADLPASPNAVQAALAGGTDAWVAILPAGGGTPTYLSYLGGSAVEGDPTFADDQSNGTPLATDASGRLYLTGWTYSLDFPTSQPLQTKLNGTGVTGRSDAFVSVVDPGLAGPAGLVYSSFLGGSKDDIGHSIDVGATNPAFPPAAVQFSISGYTDSFGPANPFPTTSTAFQAAVPVAGGIVSEGFVSTFLLGAGNQATAAYSTFLGSIVAGARNDAYGLATGPDGTIYVTGRTNASAFPTTANAIFSGYNSSTAVTGGDDVYVSRLDPGQSGNASLPFSTYVGGWAPDNPSSFAFATNVRVDSNSFVYLAGEAMSPAVPFTGGMPNAPAGFPVTSNALQPAPQGNIDAFLVELDPLTGTILYSSFLGGSGADKAYGISLAPQLGAVTLSGMTSSANFPLANPAQGTPTPGVRNAFLTRIGAP